MTRPRNVGRRQVLADAAIEILGGRGVHQLSHRAVDEAAGVPAGTTSNYFRTRDELLAAVAQRVVDLHLADMEAAADLVSDHVDQHRVADLIAASLYHAATRQRTRFLAIFELSLEATRRPPLMEALSRIGTSTLQATVGHHRSLGLRTPPDQVQALMALFGGALFFLATAPPESVNPEAVAVLARSMVRGVLGERPDVDGVVS